MKKFYMIFLPIFIVGVFAIFMTFVKMRFSDDSLNKRLVGTDWYDTDDKYNYVNGLECGLASLLHVVENYETSINKIKALREKYCAIDMSLTDINDALEYLGVKHTIFESDKNNRKNYVNLNTPWIALMKNNHYIVVKDVNYKSILIYDPQQGIINVLRDVFIENWSGHGVIVNGIIKSQEKNKEPKFSGLIATRSEYSYGLIKNFEVQHTKIILQNVHTREIKNIKLVPPDKFYISNINSVVNIDGGGEIVYDVSYQPNTFNGEINNKFKFFDENNQLLETCLVTGKIDISAVALPDNMKVEGYVNEVVAGSKLNIFIPNCGEKCMARYDVKSVSDKCIISAIKIENKNEYINIDNENSKQIDGLLDYSVLSFTVDIMASNVNGSVNDLVQIYDKNENKIIAKIPIYCIVHDERVLSPKIVNFGYQKIGDMPLKEDVKIINGYSLKNKMMNCGDGKCTAEINNNNIYIEMVANNNVGLVTAELVLELEKEGLIKMMRLPIYSYIQ